MLNNKTKTYGVIGWPIKHTASPALHNAAFGALGMDAVYEAFEVAPEQLLEDVRGMFERGVAGLNVTLPHKRAVIRLLNGLEGDARRLGVVNVIERRDDGRGGYKLFGHNTDALGFLRSLAAANVDVRGKTVLLYGAGGAAPAVLLALDNGGAGRVHVFNRTRDKAEALARDFSSENFLVAAVSDFSVAEIDTLYENADIIINATSLGLKPGELPPVAVERINPRHCVIDIIYNPWETGLLRLARERGASVVNGYGMLVYQAAEAFGIWTGREAPVEEMWAAGERFLKEGAKG